MGPERILRELRSNKFSRDNIKTVRLFLLEAHLIDNDRIEDSCGEWTFRKADLAATAQEIFDTAQRTTNEAGKKATFIIAGYNSAGERQIKIKIKQVPDKDDECLEPEPDNLVNISMKHTEHAYKVVLDILSKQATMQRDLMESCNKRAASLEKSEDVLAEIAREIRGQKMDREYRARREKKIDRFMELLVNHLAPAAVKKEETKG